VCATAPLALERRRCAGQDDLQPVPRPGAACRRLRHSHVLTIRGDSYRLRANRKSGLIKLPAFHRDRRKLTGFSLFLGDEFSSKWLELLGEAVSTTSRVAVMWNPNNPASAHYVVSCRPPAASSASRFTLRKSASLNISRMPLRAWSRYERKH
jgi:hypothetical protein